MANSDEDVDFDFFDSPRSKNEKENRRTLHDEKNVPIRNDSVEKRVTSAKPPTHPNSLSKKPKRMEESEESTGEDPDSPRSNVSVSTTQSKRTIEAKIPSVVQDDDRSDDSENDRSAERSLDRSSNSSAKDERSSTRSVTPSSQHSSTSSITKKKQTRSSDKSSVSSKEDKKEKGRGKNDGKPHKKSLYLSDDSDTDESDVDITDTDSDVTQVSPLNSPHKPKAAPQKSIGRSKITRNSTSKNQGTHSTVNLDQILSSHKDTFDLKLLLQTVLEMESNCSSTTKPNKVGSRIVLPSGDFCRQRKNYSFTNDQVLKIDRENQRLMESILRKAREAKQTKKELKMTAKRPISAQPYRPSSSAINRFRQQQKIEAENLGILRRLHQTRPTKELQRDVQIGEYKKHLVFAGYAPISTIIQPRAKSSFPRYASDSTESDSVFSGSSGVNGNRRPRPRSAFVTRPQSGKQTIDVVSLRRPRSASVKNDTVTDLPKDDEYVDDFEEAA